MPLIVKPISANLVKDYDLISKSDPYVIIQVGNEKQKSRTCQGGGKRPTWTDTFQFNSTSPTLKVQMWDDDLISDDYIGEGSVTLNQCYQNPMRTQNQYVDLISKGKSVGRILLSIEYRNGMQNGVGNGWGQTNQQVWNANQGWGATQGGWNKNVNQGGWAPNQPVWTPTQNGWNQPPGTWNTAPPNQWGNPIQPQNTWGNVLNMGVGGNINPPPQNGWGNCPPPPQNGWGNCPPPPQNGWGNNCPPPPQNGWGNNCPPPPPPQSNWGNPNPPPYNSGWEGFNGW